MSSKLCECSVVSAAAQGRTPHPLHVWSSHSLPVTDIHCGFGGIRARVFSSSLDQTCKVPVPLLLPSLHCTFCD